MRATRLPGLKPHTHSSTQSKSLGLKPRIACGARCRPGLKPRVFDIPPQKRIYLLQGPAAVAYRHGKKFDLHSACFKCLFKKNFSGATGPQTPFSRSWLQKMRAGVVPPPASHFSPPLALLISKAGMGLQTDYGTKTRRMPKGP